MQPEHSHRRSASRMTTTSLLRTSAATALVAAALAASTTTAMADTSQPALFTIVTARDEVIVAVPPDEPGAPRPEAAAIGQALAAQGALTL